MSLKKIKENIDKYNADCKDVKDVIISVLACGGKMNGKREAEIFKNKPLVINISKNILCEKKNDSILDNLLYGIQYKRLCLISYLNGNSLISEILKTKDVDKIDTVITIEGNNKEQSWKDFANLSIQGGPNFWMVHTQDKLIKNNNQSLMVNSIPFEIDESISNFKIEKPISIYSNKEILKTKIYQKDTFIKSEHIGNMMRLEYDGDKVQDKLYLMQYVQPRLWKFLNQNWLRKD